MINFIISHCRKISVVAVAAFILSAASPAALAVGEDFNFPGLSSTVTVYEDILGIPSIVGETEEDVVFVLGYIHARDRFFQMDLNRKAVAGRLAELLGPAVLQSDVEFRTFGLGRAAVMTWQVLEPKTRGVMQAYANGVNAWLRNNPLPPEYVGLELTTTEPWTPLDTVLIAKGLVAQFAVSLDDIDRTIALQAYQTVGEIAGFDGVALFFEDTHRTAPADDRVTVPGFLSSIGGIGQSSTESSGGSQKSAPQSFDYSNIRIPESTVTLAREYKERMKAIEATIQYVPSLTEISGSNVWVIGGEHTDTGYPILANDPHIPLNTPATFHEAQLVYKKEDGEPWHVSGIVAPGTGAVVLGCSKFACWGWTVNPLDTGDFFADQTLATGAFPLPTHTVHDGVPEPIQYVYQSYFVNGIGDGAPDTIVRVDIDQPPYNISYVVPRRYNGAIIGSLPTGEALTIQNTTLGPSRTLDMIRYMNQAGSLEEFQHSLEFFDTGIQNVMYADVEGNIAYFTTNEMPIREDLAAGTVEGLPPYFIRDGSGALNNEWLPVQNPQPNQILPYEILPMSEMPHVINPPSGFINNANNDPVGTSLDNNPLNQLRPNFNGIYYLSPGYADGYRMGRIDRVVKSMVADGQPISMARVAELQGNAQVLDAELILPMLMPSFQGLQLPPQHPLAQALDVLGTWDFSTPTGIAEGYDAGDDPFNMVEPDMTEIRNSAAATIWAAWRTRLLANTIDALFDQLQLTDYRPSSGMAWKAFKHHLENFETRGGIGASGLPFFPGGFTETIQGSLVQGLEMLASDEFAPAFGNSLNVLDYRWGKLHRLVLDHPLGGFLNIPSSSDTPNAAPVMNLAPDLPGVARQGGFEVVDASHSSPRASTLNGFMFGSGPNRRFVGTTGPDRITAWEVIPGGQSGVFFNPNYGSQLPLWLTNNYHPLALGEDDAVASAVMSWTMGPPISKTESTGGGFDGVSPLQPQFRSPAGLPAGNDRGDEGVVEGYRLRR